MRVGIVGTGNISRQYLDTVRRLPELELTAVADLDPDRAAAVARNYGVRDLSVEELIGDDHVDAVLNLTVPAAHEAIALQAIAASKIVYNEKPLATSRAAGARIVDAARIAGVKVGCAPDTVLGTGIQTARRAIDDGLVGTPVAATATMVTPGHERWHPSPNLYYQLGGGPLLDMGPYYLSSLISMFGPVVRVLGAASRSRDARTIGAGPRAGETVAVEVDSHVTGVLVHESGVLSTLVMSFDGIATRSPAIEVHGTEASLTVPDPNHFEGDVAIHPLGGAWEVLPVSAGLLDAGRGVGLADLAITPGSDEPRAGGRLGYHVLDVMLSLLEAAEHGTTVEISSTCDRPPPVPLHSPDSFAGRDAMTSPDPRSIGGLHAAVSDSPTGGGASGPHCPGSGTGGSAGSFQTSSVTRK
jgi:predicted dehydrogenase